MVNQQAPSSSRPRGRGRSAGALFAGFAVGFVLSLGTDEVFHLLKVYPPWGETMSDGLFALATAYRFLYNILGCYVTARLAPDRPMGHALVIGALGTFMATAGALATWNHEPPLGPHWFSIAVILISMPCAWLGGAIHLARSGK